MMIKSDDIYRSRMAKDREAKNKEVKGGEVKNKVAKYNAVHNKKAGDKVMGRPKNNLDEMQEQKMLRIEHNACWFSFWGLLAVCVVQAFIYGREDFKYITGEWLVFMCMSLYIAIDCARNGIWDRKLAPTPAVNGWASLIAGIAVFVFNFAISYKKYGALAGAAAAGVFTGALTSGICFLALTGMTYIYKKRLKKLESEGGDEEDGNGNDED